MLGRSINAQGRRKKTKFAGRCRVIRILVSVIRKLVVFVIVIRVIV